MMNKQTECKECEGTGTIDVTEQDLMGGYYPDVDTCPSCKGTGKEQTMEESKQELYNAIENLDKGLNTDYQISDLLSEHIALAVQQRDKWWEEKPMTKEHYKRITEKAVQQERENHIDMMKTMQLMNQRDCCQEMLHKAIIIKTTY